MDMEANVTCSHPSRAAKTSSALDNRLAGASSRETNNFLVGLLFLILNLSCIHAIAGEIVFRHGD